MSAPFERHHFHRSAAIWAAVILTGASVSLAATALRARGIFAVERRVESIRAEPDGEKLGTLLKGAEVEEVERDGEWVRVRVEAWIWGPSLEGFQAEEEEEEGEIAKDEATPAARLDHRQPRSALTVELNRVRALIGERYGLFYGISLDPNARQVVVRFRVEGITREALEQRQMGVQADLLEILRGEVEFDSIRVETNRGDGTGSVGLEIAITPVGEMLPPGKGEVPQWMRVTRRSSDGGDTWSGPAIQVED